MDKGFKVLQKIVQATKIGPKAITRQREAIHFIRNV